MSLKPVPAATAFAVILTTIGQSLAGGKPVECYAPYRTPPVYGTVQERVLLRAARSRVDRVPAIYGTQKVRRLIAPERVEYRIIPAQYRSMRERVLLYPETTVARTIPAVTRTEYRRAKVREGGYAWEYRTIHGKQVLCKVKRKAVYDTVAETVVVRPARGWCTSACRPPGAIRTAPCWSPRSAARRSSSRPNTAIPPSRC